MAINNYDPNTGKKLKKGQTVTFNGQKVTQGTTFGAKGSYGYKDTSASDYVDQAGGVAGRFDPALSSQDKAKVDSAYSKMFDGMNPTAEGTYANGTSKVGSTNAAGNSGLTSNVINAPNVLGTDNTKLTFPEDEVKDYSLDIPYAPQTDLEKATAEKDDVLTQMMAAIGEVPDNAAIESKLRKQLGIEKKQKAVNDLTGQLNAIVNKGQANQLSLIGQGRGIPEAIIGGQQAQIGRETAIAALPVQAQLEAAQGNLEMANDSLDRLFKIYSDDATNRYNAKNKMFEMVYNIADKKEQRLLDEKKLQNERAYQETQALNDERASYAKMAFANNQSSLGAKIAALDYKSPTFKQDLAKLTSKLSDPTKVLSGIDAPTIKSINGVDMQWNSKTGRWETPSSSGSSYDPLMVKQSVDKIQDVDKLLGDKFSLAASAGTLRNDRLLPPGYIAQVRDWRSTIGNVLANLTAAELARIKGTGVTFGALSDGERQLVAEAASVLNRGQIYTGTGENRQPTGRFKISEKLVREKLNQIKEYQKIDFEKRNGISYDSYIKDPTSLTSPMANEFWNMVDGGTLQANYGGYSLD